MKIRSIITAPNPILSQVTEKVTSFDNELESQIAELVATLRADENGVGLSANQVGFEKRVCVIEYNDPKNKNTIPLQIIVNPEIVKMSSQEEAFEEGCLSIPQMFLPVERPVSIKLRAQNQTGKKIKIAAKGILARVLQHEIDHLNGVIFTQRFKEKYFSDFPEVKKLKIIFVGTGDFADLILKGLLLLELNIPLIITEKIQSSGRNKIIAPPVAKIAHDFEKNLIETDDIKKLTEGIKKISPDILIVADFGQKIPDEILKTARLAINLHPSLLPKYRGPSPIQTAILNGEKGTGVSIIKMSAKIDQGPIIAQEKIEISDSDTTPSLKSKLSNLALNMLLKLLPKLATGQIEFNAQDEKEATYTKKFGKADGQIDWQKSPEEIDRQIRALYPWPGSFTMVDNKRLIIHHAHLENGKLVLDIVQSEGKKPMSLKDFLRGLHSQPPAWLKK